MGGKPKQSQRTKNNIKPSSSGRSAEIINSANIDTNLVCVGGGKLLPALFPTLAATASPENDIDPEFQLLLKKLNKKDPITKTKALQELTELVSNSKADDVVAILPSWAHYYKILSIDLDRRVREHTQACHARVVCASGRRAGRCVRALAAPWLLALHDAHAPAQAHAQRSLAKTFPDNKLSDMISFCKTEILTHIVDNLISNPDSVLSKKIENAEDREAQYNCIVTSSLRGLCLLTRRLAPAHQQWLWDELQRTLLHHNTFWKLAGHTCHQIRAAWFEAVGHIIERFKSTFGDKYGQKTLRILLGVSREPNASVAAGLWSCLVMIMHNIEGWHTYLDKKELIIKRIVDMLENGGWGDARNLASILLPLLACLPEDLLTKGFYETFFNAMFSGLEKKSILSSKSERQLWITNLAECLRYLSVRENDYVVEVTTSVHRTWLETTLSSDHAGPLGTNLIKHSATSMASLVKYWLKQSKEPNGEKYDQLIRNFWQNIASKISTQIDKLSTEEDEIARLIDKHVSLLQTLKTSFLHEPKKRQIIKFEDSEIVVQPESPSSEKCDLSTADRYKHNLDNVVQNVCSHYVHLAGKKKVVNAVLTPLLTLLIEFNERELFLAVARQFDVNSLIKLYEKVFREWLFDEALRCKVVVDVLFLMLWHMSKDDQDNMLDSFEQFPPAVMSWCVCASLSHPARGAASVRTWLRSARTERALQALCADHVASVAGVDSGDTRDAARNLLLMCFSHDDHEELIISEGAVHGIVRLVSKALREHTSGSLEQLSRLGAQLASALLVRADTHHAAPELIVELIGVILRVPCGDSRLSADTWREVRSAAQDGVAALPPHRRARLRGHLAALVAEPVRGDYKNPKIDIDKIEHVCALCPYILTANSKLPEDLDDIMMFTKIFFEEKAPSIEFFAVRYDCIHSKLSCPFDDANEIIQKVAEDSDPTMEMGKNDLILFMNSLLLRAVYLRTLCVHKPDEEEDVTSWCERLLSEQYFQAEFCKILYDYMMICTLHEGYGFWPHHKILRDGKSKLDTLLEDIINETPLPLRNTILSRLSCSAASTGFYWSYARRYYEVTAKCEPYDTTTDVMEKYSDNLQVEQLQNIVTGNGFFHTLQANMLWLRVEPGASRPLYLVMVRGLVVTLSRGGALDREFACELLAHCATCHLDLLVNAYYRHNEIMLFETDISEAPWHAAVTNTAVLEYLTDLVDRDGWELPAHHWDFINIACCSIATSLEKSKHAWGTTKVSMVCRSLLRLFAAVHEFVSLLPARCESREPPPHVGALVHEWRDMFSPSVHDSVFHVALHVLGSEGGCWAARAAVLAALARGAARLDWSALPKPQQLDTFALSRVCACAASCLARPSHVAYKYLAYRLLAVLVDPLILEDMGKLSMWSEQTSGEGQEEYDRPKLALEYFDEQIDYLLDIVNEVVANVKLGEGVCEVTPFTDSHSSCVGWLLLLRLSHELFTRARSTVALHYLEIYRTKNFAEPVLNAALRLLPAEVFAYMEDNTGTTPIPAQYTEMFFHGTPLDIYEPVSSQTVSALACGAVCAGVACAASGARAWAAARTERARPLRRLARAFLAPRLVREHFARLVRAAPTFSEAVITVYWSTYEVLCVYTVEDRPIELHITLAKDYPIGVTTVSTPSLSTPGADTNWVALYLAHQNGSVVEAVRMWMAGVESRVEHSPVCYICYARLHATSGKLPRQACHQCRNKFHASCLSKWFLTSSKSSCPLCRAQF